MFFKKLLKILKQILYSFRYANIRLLFCEMIVIVLFVLIIMNVNVINIIFLYLIINNSITDSHYRTDDWDYYSLIY